VTTWAVDWAKSGAVRQRCLTNNSTKPNTIILMKQHPRWLEIAMSSALMVSPALQAGTNTWFTPLTQSAPVVAPNALAELSAPWVTPEGITQNNWVSLREVEDQVLSPGQSIVRVPGQGTSASMFDMLAYHPSGSHIFIPHETPVGAGVTRYDINANKAEVIFAGDQQGQFGTANGWANDYGAFDPCRWTPNNTLFLAEEWSGLGRVIEILNPMAPADQIQFRVLESIANVSHEGINFSNRWKNTIYFIDEWNSGSIYKFETRKTGDYTVGQTFVLSVDAFASSGGNAALNWNHATNATATRFGAATWVPITDLNGVPLPGVPNPFQDGAVGSSTLGGRAAADFVGGTPYGRPEDMVVSRLPNGNEILYVAVTSEHSVISIEITSPGKAGRFNGTAFVRTFASNATPKNVGFAPTTGVLNSPDNIAMDAAGNIYVIEDAPNGDATGGDVWFVRDINNDGVGESLDHFMSIRVDGCESTGMIFNPSMPTEFCIVSMHPDSTNLANVPNGLGDAVWSFNLSGIPNKGFVQALNKGAFRFITNQ